MSLLRQGQCKIEGGDCLMEYEARGGQLLKTHPVTAVSQYNLVEIDGVTEQK